MASTVIVGGVLAGVTWLVCSSHCQTRLRILQLELNTERGIRRAAEERMSRLDQSNASLVIDLLERNRTMAELEYKLARYQRPRGAHGRYVATHAEQA
jgi:hypothetical protein